MNRLLQKQIGELGPLLFQGLRKCFDSLLRLLSVVLRWTGLGLHRREGKERVLIIQGGSIGDFVIFSPALGEFRKAFPQAVIVLLVQSPAKDLALLNKEIDQVWHVSYQSFRHSPITRLELWWKVVSMRFDVVINCAYSTSFEQYDRLLEWSLAGRRIGLCNADRHLGPTYSDLIPTTSAVTFEGHRFEDLIHYFGDKTFLWSPSLKISDLPNSRIQELIGDIPHSRYGILMPGAQAEYRRWPAEHFVKAACEITKKFGLAWLIVGVRKSVV